MAKVTFNKLTPIKKLDNKIITINEQEIEVIQYLPTAEKGTLIERVLSLAIDETGFYSPIRLEVAFHIELVKTYTNISITDKMLEDPAKVYDLLVLNEILPAIIEAIPENEYNMLFDSVEECCDQVAQYSNSFLGVLRSTQSDFNITSESIANMMGTLHDPESIGLVKDVLEKLG